MCRNICYHWKRFSLIFILIIIANRHNFITSFSIRRFFFNMHMWHLWWLICRRTSDTQSDLSKIHSIVDLYTQQQAFTTILWSHREAIIPYWKRSFSQVLLSNFSYFKTFFFYSYLRAVYLFNFLCCCLHSWFLNIALVPGRISKLWLDFWCPFPLLLVLHHLKKNIGKLCSTTLERELASEPKDTHTYT